jgi:subtilisin family serine protease
MSDTTTVSLYEKIKTISNCHAIKEKIQHEHEIVVQSLIGEYDILLQTHRIFNGIFVRIHHTTSNHDHNNIHRRMKEIKEVKRIWSHHYYNIYHDKNDGNVNRRLQNNIRKRIVNNKQNDHNQSNTTTTTTKRRSSLQDDDGCTSTWTGKGIVVGILDTGIDYTHTDFGGPGTVDAYINAYGLDGYDARNKQRDGLFPTSKVIEGYDFVGDIVNEDGDAIQDDDPIDSAGHGTAVASGVLQEAPDVTFIAAKACQSTPTGATCPTTALVAAIEYLLDPNNDENRDDKVNVITLSLGADYNNPAHDLVSLMLEYATETGVVVVTSFGNGGNVPYVAGAIGTTPNAISVGATNNQFGPFSGMEW